MENQTKHKKFWKPPSCQDFNVLFPNKKIKLDPDDIEGKPPDVSKEVAEPKTVSELAIHAKKIEEVKIWLKKNIGSRAAILFVTGPTGCGKTTTLKVVASEEGIQIREWINPINKTEYKAETILQSEIHDKYNFIETSQTDKFGDFIFRSSRYNSLFDTGKAMLILVKDIPNIFIWSPKSFHDFLDKYKRHGKCPIVFILTDDRNLKLSSSLFPNDVRNKYGITNIKFNPVNHSLSIKNLRTFCDLYRSEKVPLRFLEEISRNSGGDLRSAMNDLVLFLRTSTLDYNPKKPKLKKLKKEEVWVGSKPFSLKDGNFDFYHVLGRVLYPKRLSEKERWDALNPNQILLHNAQKIAESLSGSYLCILHENYMQRFTKLKDVVEGADCFSFCDVFSSHEELADCTNLVGVVTLMLKNTTPKKTGFNPIKKSFRFDKTNVDDDLDVLECFNYHCSKRDLLLDFMPYLKLLRTNDARNKSVIDIGEECDASDDPIQIEECDASDDPIQIEDFDD